MYKLLFRMSSNLAPMGKRTIGLGVIIAFANICAVPGKNLIR